MTIQEALLSAARLPVLGLLFLLVAAQMTVLIAAFRDGRSRRLKSALLVFFLCGAVLFLLCLAVISWENNYPGWTREPPAWLQTFCDCPVGAVWALEALMAAALFFAGRNIFRYRRRHVTQDSLKQAMDLLPVGVAFGSPEGTVVFRNLVMDHLSAVLTGKLMTDWKAFRASAGGDQVSAEGRVWQLRSLQTPDSSLTQFTAEDITEQAGILEELQEKNRKLKDIRLRLEIYNRQAERIIIAQELLTARMTVHDELGHILLESRHYLSAPEAFSDAMLLQALKNTNTYLLREYEQDDTARDPLADAIDMAETIGVEVTLSGRIPREESCRDLLSAAIQECAANAVKHAGGTAMSVQIHPEETGIHFSLQNNGRPPAGPVREAGGLLSLRTLTESKGGRMEIESEPSFCLHIFLPKENKPDKV